MLPSQSQPDATGRGLLSGHVRMVMKIALQIGFLFWNTLCNCFKHYGHGLGIKQEAVPLDIAILSGRQFTILKILFARHFLF